jgi:hypothetical protein
MIQENPYESPNSTVENQKAKAPSIQYKTRKEAFFAYFKRGAKIVWIWSIVVNSIMFLSFSIYFLSKILYREIWEGIDMRFIFRDSEIQESFLKSVLFLVFTSFIGSLIGGLWLGLCMCFSKNVRRYDEDKNFHKSSKG